MNNTQKRFIGFGICIIVRSLFVLLAKSIDNKYLSYLGFLSLLPALGFTIIYLGKLRVKGPETFGENIWWNDLRPLHAILYFTFAYFAINKNKDSYKILLLDVILGLIAFLNYHYINNSFSKLF